MYRFALDLIVLQLSLGQKDSNKMVIKSAATRRPEDQWHHFADHKGDIEKEEEGKRS